MAFDPDLSDFLRFDMVEINHQRFERTWVRIAGTRCWYLAEIRSV
jgi:hypothetical protein